MGAGKMGKVILLGAGPGDRGLLTLRGLEALKDAEVVVYDALVGVAILVEIPRTAKTIYVGKRAGQHSKTQEEINEILVEEALSGRRVVRLKGGDPFLFGRGGEELTALTARNIPFEVIPGISSALAVPAYGGIPVTHRGLSSAVHIVTTQRQQGRDIPPDYGLLAKLGGALVFLMSIARVPEICRELMAAGMDKNTPAAILQQGTTAGEKTFTGSLGNIASVVAEVQTPAIFVVGQVCALGESFHWREKLPLWGCRVIHTRLPGRGDRLSAALRELGAEVVDMPTISIVPLDTPLPTSGFSWLVFTSVTAVEIFFTKYIAAGRDIRALAGVKLAAVGAATAGALADRGLLPDLVPEEHTGRALAVSLCPRLSPKDRVLIPRSRLGSALLPQMLKESGAEVIDLPIYDTIEECPPFLAEALSGGVKTAAIFASPSAVRGFLRGARGMELTGFGAICIGPVTAKEAESGGLTVTMAENATHEEMLEAVLRAFDI